LASQKGKQASSQLLASPWKQDWAEQSGFGYDHLRQPVWPIFILAPASFMNRGE
jgi:hypothetical protein